MGRKSHAILVLGLLILSYLGIGFFSISASSDPRTNRSGRDIWLKKVEIVSTPGRPHDIGKVGETTSFQITFQNNGSAGDVKVRLKINYAPESEEESIENHKVLEYKNEKTASSSGGGAEDTTNFDWSPSSYSSYILNFSIFEPNDPIQSNNRIFLMGNVPHINDRCDSNETINLSVQNGNWHIVRTNDTADTNHSAPNAFYMGNESNHTYPAGNHTLETRPISLHGPGFDFGFKDYFIKTTFKIHGDLEPTDCIKVLSNRNNIKWKLEWERYGNEIPSEVQDGWWQLNFSVPNGLYFEEIQ